MQHTGQLEEEHESVIKAILKLDLERPHINVRLKLELLLVQMFEAKSQRERLLYYSVAV